MNIILNGKNFSPSKVEINIAELLEEKGIDSNKLGIALCLNLEVIPHQQWSNTKLEDGDRIDLVVAAPGG
jgi:sulfur carrier protein